MTHTEVERITAVETSLSLLRDDVKEVKGDVKWLRSRVAEGGGALALLSRSVPWLAGLLSVLAILRAG